MLKICINCSVGIVQLYKLPNAKIMYKLCCKNAQYIEDNIEYDILIIGI